MKPTDQSINDQAINQKTRRTYSMYARFYPIVSLLAYWIVWRGRIFKHVKFFRSALSRGTTLLDIATGDGSLTQAALFKGQKANLNLTCLDISIDMLDRAQKKMPKSVTFRCADVMALPFGDESVPNITCFGGLNSFPSGERALQEMARVLKPQAYLRGSLLLMPEARWRQRLVNKWIHEGYQTEVIHTQTFFAWIEKSKLQVCELYRFGDVLLFELHKS